MGQRNNCVDIFCSFIAFNKNKSDEKRAFTQNLYGTFSVNNEAESLEERRSCWQRTKSTLGNLLTVMMFGFGLKLFFGLLKELVSRDFCG